MAATRATSQCDCTTRFQISHKQWSDLKALLRENHHPYTSASNLVPELLSVTERDVIRCADEIKRLRSTIIALENQHGMLERQVAGYKSLLSPIRKLPPEILRHIFCCFCDMKWLGDKTDGVAGVTLGSVCAHWRSIVLSTKEVWSKIWISTSAESRQLLPLLEIQLSRSGNAPLTIEVNQCNNDDHSSEIMQLLARHCYRWYNVSLLLDYPPVALDNIKENLPILESLRLNKGYASDSPLLLFETAPQLYSVTLLYHPRQFQLRWDQIHTLSLQWCALNDILETLSRCPNLLRLSMSINSNMNSDQMNDLVEVTSQLEHFSIDATRQLNGLPDFENLLNNATFPKVTPFSVSTDLELRAGNLPESFTSFISRSSCTITTLSWENITMSPNSWVSFLESLPSLTSLTVSELLLLAGESLISNIFLRTLRPHTISSLNAFLPKLETLSLSISRPTFTVEAFMNAVKSRWLPHGNDDVACLKNVQLYISQDKCDSRIIDMLDCFAVSGMTVVLKDNSGVVLC